MIKGESIRKAKNSLYAVAVVLIMMVVPLTPIMDMQSFASTGDDDGGGAEERDALSSFEYINSKTATKSSADSASNGADSSRFIVKSDYVQNHAKYALYSDGTATFLGGVDDSIITAIESSVSYDGKSFTVTAVGNGSALSGNIRQPDDGPLVIPDSVQLIGTSAFATHDGIKQVKIGSGVQTIGKDAFSGIQLEDVIFSDSGSLKSILDGAFKWNQSLKRVSLPDSLEYLGSNVFTSVENLHIGKNLSSFGLDAFGSEISSITVSEENPYFSFHDDSLFGLQDGKETVLLQCWTQEKSYAVPDGIVEIGDNAFIHAKKIETLTVPASCEIMGSRLFAVENTSGQGYNLSKIVFGNCNNLSIKNDAFFRCSDDKNVVTTVVFDPEHCNIVSIGDNVFKKIEQFGNNASEIIIPSSTETIGNSAFSENKATKVIFKPDSNLKTLGDSAFESSQYEKVDLSSCSLLKSVPFRCFYAKNNANNVTKYELSLPTNLESIGDRAFYAYNPTEYIVTVPASVVTIGVFAFGGATTVTIETGSLLEEYGNSAFSPSSKLGKDSRYSVDLSVCSNLDRFADPIGFKKNKPPCQVEVTFPYGVLLDGKIGTTPLYYPGDMLSQILPIKKNSEMLSSIEITQGVRAIPLYNISEAVETIELKSGDTNEYFAVVDGALYLTKNGTATLVKVESGLTEFVMPENVVNNGKEYTVVGVSDNAFNGCSNLQRILISGDLEVSEPALGDCKASVLHKQTNGGRTVYLDSDLVESFSIDGSKMAFSFMGGYTVYDVLITVNGKDVVTESWNTVGFDSTDGVLVITADPRSRASADIAVDFMAEGGSGKDGSDRATIRIPSGMTILDSEIPEFNKDSSSVQWMLGDSVYDFNSPVTSSITLRAHWIARDPMLTIDTASGGSTVATIDDKEIFSGEIVKSGSTVRIVGVPEINHEIASWTIRTGDSERIVQGYDIEIELTRDTTVTPVFRYYQSSNVLPSITESDDAPRYSDIKGAYPKYTDSDSLQLQWTLGGYVDTSMSTWTGGVSIPLIVDDYVYVRQADHIFKADSQTGYVVASCESRTATGFYHSLAYGNGVILDTQTGRAFDLDLVQVFSFPEGITSLYYDRGVFYTAIGKILYSMDSVDSDKSRSDEMKELKKVADLPSSQVSSYGTFSEPVFQDGVLYLLTSEGSARSLVAVSLSDGKTGSIVLKGLESHLFDDGWLTYYNGRIYTTSYVQGLFGDFYAKGYAAISSVAVSGTEMSDLKITYLDDVTSILSKFVIHEGRGYVNACVGSTGSLMIYNVSDDGDLEFVYKRSSTKSHGSIVVNTSESTEANHHKVTIYLLPYDTQSNVYFFTDDTSFTSNTKENKLPQVMKYSYADTSAPRQYCSQAVRIGMDGQLIWYNDSGQLMSFVKKTENRYYVFVQEGNSGTWYESAGGTAYDALSGLDALSFDEKTRALTKVNGISADSFDMYVVQYGDLSKTPLYETVKIQNLADSVNDVYHYYIITDRESIPSTGGSWKYLDDDLKIQEYTFRLDVGDKNVIGRSMAVSGQESVVEFYDEGKLVGRSMGSIGSRSGLITPPELVKEGQYVVWTGLPDVLTMAFYKIDARGVPTMGVTTSIDEGMYAISTTLEDGANKYGDDKNLNLVLALKYDDRTVWTFAKIDWSKSTSFSYSVSCSGLVSATLMVVDGNSYSSCTMLAIAECALAYRGG